MNQPHPYLTRVQLEPLFCAGCQERVAWIVPTAVQSVEDVQLFYDLCKKNEVWRNAK